MSQLITEAEVDALPLHKNCFLYNYIQYASQCTDAHKAYHVVCGLGALAQTTPQQFAFPFGSPMYSHIYGLCIGKSTESRKSAGISIATKLVEEAIPSSTGEQPGSKENLIDALRVHPRQLISYGEFGSFLAATEKGYMMPLKTTYTEAWDGSNIGRGLVRKTKEMTEAKNPRLSLLCGSTLDFLERHTEPSDWTGGFMSRFLTMYPDRERTWSRPPGAPAEMRGALVRCLAGFNEASGDVIANDSPKWGECVGFTQEADAMWDQWYFGLSRLAAASNANEVAGGIARTHAHAVKIALLLAWDSGLAFHGRPWALPAEVLRPALMIADMHIRSLLRVGENLAASKDMRERHTVLEAIRHTPQPLGLIIRRSKLLKRRTTEIVETLIEEGMVRIENGFDTRGVCYRLATPDEIAEMSNPVETPQPPPMFGDTGGGATVLQLFPTSSTPPKMSKGASLSSTLVLPELAPLELTLGPAEFADES